MKIYCDNFLEEDIAKKIYKGNGPKDRIAVLTEADQQVASGHLKECIVLTEELIKVGYSVSLWVNADIPEGFLTHLSINYFMYKRPIQMGIMKVIDFLKEELVKLLIINLREVSNELILSIKSLCKVPILCIDEFGHRCLDCDIIVNPMVDKKYGQYEGSFKKIYIGNQYLVLPIKYYEWNQRDKKVNTDIQEITISMGGVDVRNTTQKIVNWLQQINLKTKRVNIVLGAGYRFSKELKNTIWRKNYFIFHNINYLDQLFYESDIVFCAGGNTLHELACIGTAAITIPTMPHEYRNGMAFEEIGFGKCYKGFNEFAEDMTNQFEIFFNEKRRTQYMYNGKKCSDGGGYLRMLKIIHEALI